MWVTISGGGVGVIGDGDVAGAQSAKALMPGAMGTPTIAVTPVASTTANCSPFRRHQGGAEIQGFLDEGGVGRSVG